MKLRTALPNGINNKMCERHDPSRMGGDPPIRFVPSLSASGKKEEGETEDNQVKITISADVQKYYPIFKEGDTEAVINLIWTHQGIMSDKKLKERYAIVEGLVVEIKARITRLTRLAHRTDDEKQQVREDQVALKEYKAQLKQLPEEAFDFFEKLLDQSLVPTWREIVKTECETANYVNLLGQRVTLAARGKVFAALEACYYKIVLLVATQDAAERMKRYMTTIVKKAEDVKIVELFSRMNQLNKMIEFLPCLKHMKDSPANLPTMNNPF